MIIQNELWKKYGLCQMVKSLNREIYTEEEELEYNNMVSIAHDFVASWWEAHPEDRCLYYDALKKASPEWDAKVLAWAIENRRREKELSDKHAQWEINAKKLSEEIRKKRGITKTYYEK